MISHAKRSLGLLLFLTVSTLGWGGCSGSMRAEDTKADPAAPKPEEAVPVELTTLAQGPMEAVLRFSTNLEAEESVEVFSQAARQVRELLVEEGQAVSRGQVLLRLQDEEQKTALAKVESQLARVQREYERQQRLFTQQLISEQKMNDSTYELDQLKLAREEALRELSYTEVKAPIGGTVTQRLVGLGDQVTPNQHLFDLVAFSSIVARIYVPEKELPRLRNGLSARITSPALGDSIYTGKIERLAPIVDPKSGTVKVTVALPDTRGLKPGMFVDVELVTATRKDALRVPKRALIYDNDQVFVYRIGSGDRVSRVLIQPVLEDRENIEAASGLAAGDRLVVAGQAALKDGALVRVMDGRAPAASEVAP